MNVVNRVGLNGRFTGVLQPTGTQTAAYWLYDSIIRSKRDFEVVLFADLDGIANFPEWRQQQGVEFVNVPFRRFGRIRSNLWEQIIFPRKAKRHGCDLIHNPINTCPIFGLGLNNYVTVHDLNFIHHAKTYSLLFRNWLTHFIVPAIKSATKIVCVSGFVRDDVVQTLGVEPEKVSKIYNGVRPLKIQSSKDYEGRRYVLAVNPWQPHKNVIRLIKAWKRLTEEDSELELLIVGRPQENFNHSRELLSLISDKRIQNLGYLTNEDLAGVYSSATAFCYPSLEEGFGLPILESLSLGTPVVTSNLSCLPEVGSDVCFYVDPFSIDSIEKGLREAVYEELNNRQSRVNAGIEHARKFLWSEAGKSYCELFSKQFESRIVE
ncbi:MAG: hypothetical protein CMC15_15840 [Flavobacteriaceae bacterium]|nr:hypothetical protein [Flavobacteriaceae bacterium]